MLVMNRGPVYCLCGCPWLCSEQVSFVFHSQLLPQPPPSCLVVKSLHRAGQLAWTLSMYWEVSCNGAAIIRDLGCCWGPAWVRDNSGYRHPTWTPPQGEVASVSYSWVFPQRPRSSAMPLHGVSGSRWFAQPWPGVPIGVMEAQKPLEQTSLLLFWGQSQRVSTPCKWSPAISQPFVSLRVPPVRKVGCLPCLGPHDCGVQCSSDLSLPRACVLFLSVPLPGAQVLTWQLLFLSYPVTCGSFLQPCWPRSLFASLWFFFSENSSICRWIFNVFVGGGELHLLLLCQLNLKPLFMCFILLLLLLFFGCITWLVGS